MPKITITFQEEGNVPVSFEIPEAASAKIAQFIADTYTWDDQGNKVYSYSSHWDLFLKHNLQTLILPIINKYASDVVPGLSDLETQRAQIEAAIAEAKIQAAQASLVPLFGTPS